MVVDVIAKVGTLEPESDVSSYQRPEHHWFAGDVQASHTYQHPQTGSTN